MADTDTSASDEQSEVTHYSERDPLFLLFTEDRFVSVLNRLAEGMDPNRLQLDSDIAELFVEWGVLFEDTSETLVGSEYELNQRHEFVKVLQSPHISRLIGNEPAVAVLMGHLDTDYLQCLSIESLETMYPYSTEELEDAVSLLRSLRLVRGTMVVSGQKIRENVEDDVRVVLSQVDALSEVLNENESVSTEELEMVLGDVDNPDEDDEKTLVMSETEFYENVKACARAGIESVRTTNNITTLESGTHGTRLNRDDDLTEWFRELDLAVMRHTSTIQDMCGLET